MRKTERDELIKQLKEDDEEISFPKKVDFGILL